MNVQALIALAEPNRLRIVEMLDAAPRPVGEIAATLALRQPQATKHLQILERAGLVTVHPLGRRRVYALHRQAFGVLADWARELGQEHPSEEVLQQYEAAIDAESVRLQTDQGPRTVRLRRSLAVPPTVVWQAWTDAELVRRWWSPEHFTVNDCTVQPVEGGGLAIVLAEGDGNRHRAAGRFLTVQPPGRLEFELSPQDEDGRAIFRARYSVRFTAADPGTMINLRIRADRLDPSGAQALAGLRFGWQQMLDKLARLYA